MTSLVKTQLRILVAFFASLAIVVAVSGIVQFAKISENRRLQDRNDTQVEFWRSIAGYNTSSVVSAETNLATDLQAILDDPQAINNFRGDPDLYGGITEAIGFDPFNGVNCSECGPLDANVKNNLALINKGKIDQVVAKTQIQYDTDYTFTLFGISTPMQMLLLYLLLGPASYISALKIMGQNAEPDLQMFLSIPYAYAWVKIRDGRAGRKDDSEARRQFPEYCALLDDVDEAIAALPQGTERNTLVDRRNEVRIELLRQVHSSHNAKSQDEMRELADALDSLSTTLKARSEARKALDGW